MKTLTDFYQKNDLYITEIKSIIDQNSIISLRILDWFITNYSKKYRTFLFNGEKNIDVYQHYKLQLKSYGKSSFDPFCRKNKIQFFYNEDETEFIETSCGQLCFFRWCFENNILDYVKQHLDIIENDMKTSLKNKKIERESSSSDSISSGKKRQPLSISAARSIVRQNIPYVVEFD